MRKQVIDSGICTQELFSGWNGGVLFSPILFMLRRWTCGWKVPILK